MTWFDRLRWWLRERREANCDHGLKKGNSLKPAAYDAECITTLVDGVDFGWDGLPHKSYIDVLRCRRCGAEFNGERYVLALDMPERDAYGWPVNDNGERIPMVER